MVFFSRKGRSLSLSSRAEDYAPGDLVTWDLDGGVPHIGVVVDQKYSPSGCCMIVHNIGHGWKMSSFTGKLLATIAILVRGCNVRCRSLRIPEFRGA